MTKQKLFIISAGIITMCSFAACAPSNQKQLVSTGTYSISETIVSTEPEESTYLSDGKLSTESKTDMKLEELSKLFTSDNADYTIKELSFSGPMCTDLVIENSKKVYSDSIDNRAQDYPSLEFNSEDDFASIGWWPEGNKVHLQFWNINHKKEAEFSIDGANFKLVLPEASYDEIELNVIIDNEGEPFSLGSLYKYSDAVVLNLEVSTKKFPDLETMKLKMQDTEFQPYRIHIENRPGKIGLLYQFDDSDLANTSLLSIQEILYQGKSIYKSN